MTPTAASTPSKFDPPSAVVTAGVIQKKLRLLFDLSNHIAQMAKQFRRLRRGIKRILGALCLMRTPRPSEEDPKKPGYFQIVPATSKPSIDVTPVVNRPTYPRRFPLLQLPVELQLEVIDSIYDLSKDGGNSAGAGPLLNLRLYVFILICSSRLIVSPPILPRTCKYFALLCCSLAFRSMDLTREGRTPADLLQKAPYLAKHLQVLTLETQSQLPPKSKEGPSPSAFRFLDASLVGVLHQAKNLRDLTLLYTPVDLSPHDTLLPFLSHRANFPRLHSLELFEIGIDYERYYAEPAQDDIPQTFYHNLTQTMLQTHGPYLRRFIVHSSQSFHSTTISLLRQTASRLTHLHIGMGLGIALRSLFAEPVPWACAETLEHLTFRDCLGGHLGIVASHVGRGYMGANLKTLSVVVCGDPSDDQEWPAPLQPEEIKLRRPLEQMQIDHAEAWELRKLAGIPVEELIVTRVFRLEVIEALSMEGAWPGVKRIRVPSYPTEVDDQLKDLCEKRGVELEFSAVAWGHCWCHPQD